MNMVVYSINYIINFFRLDLILAKHADGMIEVGPKIEESVGKDGAKPLCCTVMVQDCTIP